LAANDVQAKIELDQIEARRLEIRATPTFYVGVMDNSGTAQLLRKMVGSPPYNTMKGILDELANRAVQKPSQIAGIARWLKSFYSRN
jgi:predicted DsbA family dithiol-disulfide isomerase